MARRILTTLQRERLWRTGKHENEFRKIMLLEHMNYEHLENTIRAFPGHDVTPLKKELRRRDPWVLKKAVDILRRRESSPVKKKSIRAKKARVALERYLDLLNI